HAQRGTASHPPLPERSGAEAPGARHFRRGKERRDFRRILGRALELAPPEGDPGGDRRELARGGVHRFMHGNGALRRGPSYWVAGCAATVRGPGAGLAPEPGAPPRPASAGPPSPFKSPLFSAIMCMDKQEK